MLPKRLLVTLHAWANLQPLAAPIAPNTKYGNLEQVLAALSGPLNRLNARLCLLQTLDRYRTPSAIGSAIGRALSRPISHPHAGGSSQPPLSKPLSRPNRAIVAL